MSKYDIEIFVVVSEVACLVKKDKYWNMFLKGQDEPFYITNDHCKIILDALDANAVKTVGLPQEENS
jgi:hypothetical protein